MDGDITIPSNLYLLLAALAGVIGGVIGLLYRGQIDAINKAAQEVKTISDEMIRTLREDNRFLRQQLDEKNRIQYESLSVLRQVVDATHGVVQKMYDDSRSRA